MWSGWSSGEVKVCKARFEWWFSRENISRRIVKEEVLRRWIGYVVNFLGLFDGVMVGKGIGLVGV